jgi:hypothetical protein
MTAEPSPATQVLPVPGTSFLVLVHNTGNTEDSYTATITGTTGPVTATLTGLDGMPTQTVPLFRLPGLSTGALVLNTGLAAAGTGTVRVQVKSLADGSIASTVLATVMTAAVSTGTPPPASAPAQPAPGPGASPPLPALTGVQVLTRGGKRGKPTALVLTFTGALSAAAASDPGHYGVFTGGKIKRKFRKLRQQKLVNVLGASYDPAHQAVVLRLGKVKNRKTQGTLEIDGLADALGRAFDVSAGSVNLKARKQR